MSANKKTTVMCCQCKIKYEVDTSQYKYQMKKNPTRKWFHNGSCASTFRNKERLKRIGPEAYHGHLKSHPGNQFRRKYPIEYTWYMHRITTDSRSHTRAILNESERMEMVSVLDRQWQQQNGRCSFTNVKLKRRISEHGSVDTDNPFVIASLDRIDSTLPYQEGNIQWVSAGLNQAKGNLNDSEFRKYLTTLLTYNIVSMGIKKGPKPL